MDSIFEHYNRTGYLHHAHIIEGVHAEVVPMLLHAIERHMEIVVKGNPDLTVLKYQSLGINEARELSSRQSRASFSESAKRPDPLNPAIRGGSPAKDSPSLKFFIISTQSFTQEAQSALLKTFEEPTDGTHFFIIVPQLDTILPTLKSRVVFVRCPTSDKNDETSVIAEKLLNSTLEQRFAMIKKLTVASKGLTRHDSALVASIRLTRHDSAESKKGESVDREKIRRILDHIERILYTQMAGKLDNDIFREIFQTKTYLNDRGSSAKMLLDHISLMMPHLK